MIFFFPYHEEFTYTIKKHIRTSFLQKNKKMTTTRDYETLTDVEKQDYDRIAQKIDNWVERVPGSTTLHKIEMMRFVELWYKDVDKSSREFDAWCDYCLKSINEHRDTDCFWK